MNKYEKKFKKTAILMNNLNELKLSLLLLNFKLQFINQNSYVKFRELNNDLCLTLIIYSFSECSPENRAYLKKQILDKIDKSMLYKKYIKHLCNELLDKNENQVQNILKSLVLVGFAQNAQLIKGDKQNFIEITMNTNKKIKFSHIPLDRKLVDSYRSNCHAVTSFFAKQDSEKQKVAITLEPNEICGNYYHSFIIKDNIVYDLAHNVMIPYDSYIELFRPEILVCDEAKVVLEEIKNLENDQQFIDCNYIDVLKYGLFKQMSNNKKLLKKEFKQKK